MHPATEAIINRRDPTANLEALWQRRCTPTGFHTGTRHGWGTYIQQERFHCLFVKTLAYLTDVGPGDGGTAVAVEDDDAGTGRRIVKTKAFQTKPMTPEEAILQMDLLGHDFFFFTSAETERAAVVYRREDGDVGLIDQA